ncbi:hypothetical protein H9L15_03170 [Sphingomonas daechungensis]|uniref:Copper chaperone PCu(A)C n=1 Tax=Sphingomonas daechungensis TaxID=1176646 RepID=A0ABX6T1I6_9SPHN|nr:hypothetical protein [Sphingomonas daechungensis]QNP43697.1 hypothetical protein H9L15_03170 [Sphingomonas daechungensis]
MLTVATAAWAEPPAKLAGLYEIRQMEMGGGLELRPDGRFRYALEYGAASEEGEGDWTVEGSTVLLTSNPKPQTPNFVLVKDEPAPDGQLSVTLEPPGFGWTGRMDLVATVAGQDRPVGLEASSDGDVDTGGATVTSIRPVVPIYGFLGDPIPLKPGGHRLVLRFTPNDLGKAVFDREPLAIEDGKLLMRRYETVITFRRVEP